MVIEDKLKELRGLYLEEVNDLRESLGMDDMVTEGIKCTKIAYFESFIEAIDEIL
ncbi:MAG: hypothetical protein RR929_00205 [Erysipelotrichaceae bacterium]